MSTTTTKAADNVPRSIGRVLDLLEVVLAENSCSLTKAASESGLTPTTALRHLRALEARGYVDRDSNGAFSAGPTLVRIAEALHGGGPLERIASAAQPLLDGLARTTGESAYLAVAGGNAATYIATATSERAIRHVGWVGQQVPLDATAVGAALMRPGVVATRTGSVEPDTTAISLALPPMLDVHIALSVIGPAHRLTKQRRNLIERSLREAAEQLAERIGPTEKQATP